MAVSSGRLHAALYTARRLSYVKSTSLHWLKWKFVILARLGTCQRWLKSNRITEPEVKSSLHSFSNSFCYPVPLVFRRSWTIYEKATILRSRWKCHLRQRQFVRGIASKLHQTITAARRRLVSAQLQQIEKREILELAVFWLWQWRNMQKKYIWT